MAQVTAWGDPDRQPFERLPEGVYTFRFEKVEQKASQNEGPGYLEATAKIIKTTTGAKLGETHTVRISLKETMLWQLREILDQAGVYWERVAGPDDTQGLAFDTDHLIGATLQATCVHNRVTGNDGKERVYENFNDWKAEQVTQAAAGASAPTPSGNVPPQAVPRS